MYADSPSEQLRVLMIDDDSGMRSSLKRILKLDGYLVDEADTAAVALSRSNWHDYFAILLDRKLPDGSAEELLPRIRALAPHVAVLIITGNADLESSIEALRQGAADYLLKPVEPESLRARLRGLARLRTAQLELARRDDQLRFMVEHLPAAAAYVDFGTGEVRFNGVVREITGYSPAELATLDDCFACLFGQRSESFRRLYHSNHSRWRDEATRLPITRRDGEQRVVEFRGYRYDHHEVWLLQDVTERDRHETELRIRDQAIQSANEGIVIADARQSHHPIIFVNKAFENLSGFSFDEVIGKGCEMICGSEPPRDALLRLRQAIQEGVDFRATLPCLRKNGQEYWNEISLAPVKSGDNVLTHIVAVMEDVSERRKAQQKLLQSERLAAIGQMVTGLAHESRNALQRAQACLDMLALDLEDQPEQLELTTKTHRALQDLYRYYEEVRNYAAPINLERRTVDLKKLWQNTWQDLESARFGRKIELVEVTNGLNLQCSVDQHRIEQVFRNIIENAIAAMPEEGRLVVEASQPESQNGQFIQLLFRDNGPGFDSASISNVFQPFFTTKQKGTGLGMAIAKRIVEAHGGGIEIATSAAGAEVCVTLPRQVVSNEQKPSLQHRAV